MRTMLRTISATALTALTLLATACSSTTSDRDLVYRRPAEAMELANTRRGALGTGGMPKVLWLDPRTEKEFAAGHMPNAVNIPFPDIERVHEVKCKGFDMYIVYDTDYDDVMAKAASKRLMELGYRPVYTVLGGLKAWKTDGFTVEVVKSGG